MLDPPEIADVCPSQVQAAWLKHPPPTHPASIKHPVPMPGWSLRYINPCYSNWGSIDPKLQFLAQVLRTFMTGSPLCQLTQSWVALIYNLAEGRRDSSAARNPWLEALYWSPGTILHYAFKNQGSVGGHCHSLPSIENKNNLQCIGYYIVIHLHFKNWEFKPSTELHLRWLTSG